MNSFLAFLTVINFLGIAYLTYVIYKKNLRPPTQSSMVEESGKSIKIQLTRFNPFSEVGGDQSFILCLLDKTNSGAIITSLHNRDFTRVYAKPIKIGQPDDNMSLSAEEKIALKNTINS